jgi:hypothetical protein
VIKNLIKDSYNKIFADLYKITEGKIILGGSTSLALLGIINRESNDLDVMITHEDWLNYKSLIVHYFQYALLCFMFIW